MAYPEKYNPRKHNKKSQPPKKRGGWLKRLFTPKKKHYPKRE